MTLYAARLVFLFELSHWCLCLSCPCISLQSKRQNKREKGNKREEQKRAFSRGTLWPLALFAAPTPTLCPSLCARRYAPPPSPSAALTAAHLHAHRPHASVHSDPLADHLSLSSSSVVCPPDHSPSLTPPSLCITPLRAGEKMGRASIFAKLI